MNPSQFPSILVCCPCSEALVTTHPTIGGGGGRRRISNKKSAASLAAVSTSKPGADNHDLHDDLDDDVQEEEEDEGETFDPRASRAKFSQFPLANLLFCEDCNQVRCPRCVQDEIVSYYCPSCLFEVPSSTVKSEGNRYGRERGGVFFFQFSKNFLSVGLWALLLTKWPFPHRVCVYPEENRCTRNCFFCPICFASLSVTATGEDQTGPFILLCSHCLWSTHDIGIEFEKSTSITAQLAAKLKAASNTALSSSLSIPDPFAGPISPRTAYFLPPAQEATNLQAASDEEIFARLKAFYNQQNTISGSEDSRSLSRLMGVYNTGSGARQRSYGSMPFPRVGVMDKTRAEWQEFENVWEVNSKEEDKLVEKMRSVGFEGSTAQEQRIIQSHNPRFLEDLRPLAALLRTKRSKRCRSCRHILVKPDSKVTAIRYRIRLVAAYLLPSFFSHLSCQNLTTV
jgi:dynactin-4